MTLTAVLAAWLMVGLPRDGAPEFGTTCQVEPAQGGGLGDASALSTVPLHAFLPRRPDARLLSKKAAWLAEKAARPNVRLTDAELAAARTHPRAAPSPSRRADPFAAPLPPAGTRVVPLTTLFSVRLKEAVAVLPGRPMYEAFAELLRDHYTNQQTDVDAALLSAVTRAAIAFRAPRVEVISGYRSAKYNLSLRKKGREVARSSQHCEGRAVDFRLRGVSTRDLWRFVRGLRLGGVGYYPHSRFVHCDTGPVRFWKGE